MNLKILLKNLCQDRISLNRRAALLLGVIFFLTSATSTYGWSFGKGSKKEETKKEQSVSEEKGDSSFSKKVEDIRRAIFEKEKQACKVVAKSFDMKLAKYDPKLEALISGVIDDLKKRDTSSLMKKFHPRMKVSKYHVKTKIFATLSSYIFTNPSYSLYRVWALDAKGKEGSSIDCDEEYRMNPHYGYDLQFGVWIQVMSDVELGWIYTTVVPYKSGWVLASFDVRQLSSEEKQAMDWDREARADYDNNLINLSYLKFDVARKLSYSGGFVYVKNLDVIKNDIYTRFSDTNPLMELMKPIVEGRTILRAESNFASNGMGVFLRYGVTWKESDNSLNEQCRRIAKAVLDIKEFSTVKGVMCSFSLPGEDLNIDGARGSIYIPRESGLKKKK